MRILRIVAPAATLGACAFCLLAQSAALPAQQNAHAFELRSGEELTFAATIADGKVVLGTPRLSKFGAAQPKDGEITIGVSARDETLHDQIVVTEKTSAPIDFLATGLNGETKIDEAIVCGRLDAPFTTHIGSVPWRIRLREFEARKDGEKCE
jgi:hypothetical protein